MKKYFFLALIMVVPFTIIAQANYVGLFDSQDLSNPAIHADGIFKFFIESDNQLKFGNPEQAILILDNAIAQNPFFAETYLKRSKLLARMGRHREAQSDLRTAQQLNPYLGKFYNSSQKSGRIELIAFDPEKKLTLDSQVLAHSVALVEKTIEKKLQGDVSGALIELDQVFAQIDHPTAQLYDLRGSLHLLQNDFQGAVADYSKAIQMAPNVPEFYFNRGVAKLFTYNRSAACEDLEISNGMGFERSAEKLKHFCYY